MADDLNPALRAELEAALDVLEPQIRGLQDLVLTSISPALASAVNNEINERRQRERLIRDVIAYMDHAVSAMEALEADGYPALPNVTLDPALFAELQGEESDLDAAVGVFEGSSPASSLTIGLSGPVPKT